MIAQDRAARLLVGFLLAASPWLAAREALAGKLIDALNVPVRFRSVSGEPGVGPETLVRGSADAKVTLVEYSDYQCPYCGPKRPDGKPGGYATVEALRGKYGDALRIVFKNYPLTGVHPQALPAAQWVQAAALQSVEKAWALHDKLFENQDKLGEAFYAETARGLGLDVKRLRKDAQGPAVKEAIDADLREAARFGFGGTPSFIVRGVAFAGALEQKAFEDVISADTDLAGGAEAELTQKAARLLDEGADANEADLNGNTALAYAGKNGHVGAAKALLARGARADSKDKNGVTALMLAAGAGQKEAVRLLLEAGADLDAKNAQGQTAVDYAALTRNKDIAALLIERGGRAGDAAGPAAKAPEVAVRYAQSPEIQAKVKELEALRAQKAMKEELAALERQIAQMKGDAGSQGVYSSDVDEPGFQRPQRPQDWALVVGIESYQNDLPKADFAERDAEMVRKYLLALGVPPQNVVLLKGQRATQSAIKSYLEEYLPKNVDAGSRVYFYYSGHGAPDPATGSSYLVPWEADPRFIKVQGFPVRELYADLKKLKAKEVLVAMDACFSGAGGRSVLAHGARPLVVTREESSNGLGDNAALFAAARGDEITGGLDEQGHGLFTYYLLKGLRSGAKDARGLYEFLKPQVAADARRQNREQDAVFEGANLRF